MWCFNLLLINVICSSSKAKENCQWLSTYQLKLLSFWTEKNHWIANKAKKKPSQSWCFLIYFVALSGGIPSQKLKRFGVSMAWNTLGSLVLKSFWDNFVQLLHWSLNFKKTTKKNPFNFSAETLQEFFKQLSEFMSHDMRFFFSSREPPDMNKRGFTAILNSFILYCVVA